jgi:hypothetical protein
MVKTDDFYFASFQKRDGLIRPIDTHPAIWGNALVVEVDFHVATPGEGRDCSLGAFCTISFGAGAQ